MLNRISIKRLEINIHFPVEFLKFLWKEITVKKHVWKS